MMPLTEINLFIINYSISELNFENIINEAGTFYRISIPDHISTAAPGKPELPVLSRLISVPEGAVYKIKISEVKSSRINPAGKKLKVFSFPSRKAKPRNSSKINPIYNG